MSQIKLKLFLLLMFLVFTQGMWERIFFFSSLIQYLIDGAALAFILFQFKFNFKMPGASVFLFLCLVSFFVGFSNNGSLVDAFFYMRFLFYTYLIYNQLFSRPITLNQWSLILKFLCIMILIQGVGALFNIFVLGARVEGYVGLMSSLGGTTATVFPLIISTLILVYYLFSHRLDTKTLIVLILLFFSGLLVGFSSGKRGIYFIIPLVLISTILLALPTLTKNGFIKKKIAGLALAGMLIFPLMIYGMINSKGLNYGLSGNETVVEIVTNSLNYADDYEDATDQYGSTIGRSNTSSRIIENTFSDSSLFFLGLGFGATKSDIAMQSLGYKYGIVGFTRDVVSGGFFLSFFTIILICRIILINKSIKTNVSTLTRRAMVIVFLYTHLFYSSDFTVSLKINLILILIMVLLNSPVHHMVLLDLLKTKKLIK